MRQLQVGSGTPRADASATALRRAGPDEAPVDHEARIGRLLGAAGIDTTPAEVVAAVRARAVITVNFHAGRLLDDRRSVAEVLGDDGVYECRFAAPLAGDRRPASPGDDPDHWRTSMRVAGAEAATHGGLDLLDQPNGACPRFGACRSTAAPGRARARDDPVRRRRRRGDRGAHRPPRDRRGPARLGRGHGARAGARGRRGRGVRRGRARTRAAARGAAGAGHGTAPSTTTSRRRSRGRSTCARTSTRS